MASSPTFEFASFARHQERLRVFVSALVADEHAADDVVQDVWLRASREGRGAGPATTEATWSWLRSIARRVAGNHRRADSRRRIREHGAARGESLPSSAELAAEVELHRRVLDALDALPEPHQTLLRDHHLGGLTIRQLADRAGISPHTMKDRVVRARREMRRALELAGVDERSRSPWAPAMMPWTWRRTTPLALTGTLAMKATLAMAAAALIAVTWLLSSPATTPNDGVPMEPQASPTQASVKEPVELSPPQAERARLAPGAPVSSETQGDAEVLDWIVRGRAWLQQGAPGPLPTVRVHLAMYEGGEIQGEALARTVVTSDEAGHLEWALPNPGRTVSIEARADPVPGYTVRTERHHVAVLGEGPVESISVRLNPHDAWVEGVVRASASAPTPGALIAGARVAFLDATTETDDAGAYRLAIPSRGYGSLICIAENFHRANAKPGGRKAGATLRMDLELDPEFGPEGTIFGYVRDQRGAVLPGATVKCSSAKEETIRADATGYYELTGIERSPDALIPITASHPGYAPIELYAETPADGSHRAAGTQLDFRLWAGARVHGTVRDSSGAPVPGATLWIGDHANFASNREAYTDATGAFEIENIAPGTTLLGVRKRDQPEYVQDLEVTDAESDIELAIVLASGLPLRGRVVDSEGLPLKRVQVLARGAEYGRARGSSTATGADGRFELAGCAPGDLEVVVSKGGFVPQTLSLSHTGEALEVVLQRQQRLAGRVVNAATGEPIEAFTVRLLPPEDPTLRPWFSGMDGSWVFGGQRFSDALGQWTTGENEPIQAGVWTLIEVEAPGFETLRLGPIQVEPEGSGQDLVHRLVPR